MRSVLLPALTVFPYRDGHRDTDKKHEDAKADRSESRLVSEFMVKTPGNSATQPKRKGHAQSTNTKRDTPVADQKSQVDFKTNEEEEKHEAKIGSQRQGWHRCVREDGSFEARDPAHSRGTE